MGVNPIAHVKSPHQSLPKSTAFSNLDSPPKDQYTIFAPSLNNMFRFLSTLIVFLIWAGPLLAQDSLVHRHAQKADSITGRKTKSLDSLKRKLTAEPDTLKKLENSAHNLSHYENKALDSLNKKFTHRTDSLQRAYTAPLTHLNNSIAKLNYKKDSLTKLNLPTNSVTHKIDSLHQEQTKKLNELNGHIAKVKKQTLDEAGKFHLPPQAQNELNSFTKDINGFKVPDNFFKLPNFKVQGLQSIGLPTNISSSLKLPSNLSVSQLKIPSLQKLDLKSMKVPSLSQMEGSLGSELKNLQALKSVDAKTLEKEVTNLAGQNSEAKSLLKEQSQAKDLQKELSQVKSMKPDSAALQQLKPAVNHFAGKENELTAAMDKVSKLKQKYTSVKSLSELPKRVPNPLKEKPWIERIVPGLNYFIQSRHYTLVDFNPYVGWRFNPRLIATIGWNERVGISHWSLHTNQYDRVHGVRAATSYLWTHGINFKIAPELMSAYIPTNGVPDVKHKALVFGVYAGVRKDFPIYKWLKGYSEVMYNFTQKTFQNIYGDPVSFRFGLEVQLKKKAKAKTK